MNVKYWYDKLPGDRVIAWFSAGAASAVAAKMCVDKWGEKCEVVYIDLLNDEHPDNRRFIRDVEKWIGKEIKLIKNDKYRDRWELYEKTRFLVSPYGAKCTIELKKSVRMKYQRADDLHVFGYTADEYNRAIRFLNNNPELYVELPLIEYAITKSMALSIIENAGILIPEMYRLGYTNNNCIGCVKGGAGYWNKIRKDFPDVFDRMAKLERKLNTSILRIGGKNVFLDELRDDQGNYSQEKSIECGILCGLIDDMESKE